MIIGPEHGLVQISASMTMEFSYFGRKRLLSNCSYRKQTGISMCLTLGVTILDSTTEIQLVLSSQCTVGSPVWNAKAPMYLWITLVLLTAFYMHLISLSVDSDAIYGWFFNFQKTSTPSILWIIPETDRLLLRILAWSAYWWHFKQFCVVWYSTWFLLHVNLMKFDPS